MTIENQVPCPTRIVTKLGCCYLEFLVNRGTKSPCKRNLQSTMEHFYRICPAFIRVKIIIDDKTVSRALTLVIKLHVVRSRLNQATESDRCHRSLGNLNFFIKLQTLCIVYLFT